MASESLIPNSPIKAVRLICLVVGFSLCASCATRFGETHYLKSVDEAGDSINYFQLNVSGGAFLSSARYMSGYFDETALDTYFGESIVQPAGGRINKQPGSDVIALNATQGGKLLMILSTNADAIATNIGQMADNREFGTTLARLIRRNSIEEGRDVANNLTLTQSHGKVLAELGDKTISNLDVNTVGAPAARASVLFYANVLARELGSGRNFVSLAELKLWLDQQRR